MLVYTPLYSAKGGGSTPEIALFRGVCTHLLLYTPLYSARGVVAPPKSPYSGGCVHTCCNTPPCVVRGGVVDTNSDLPPPKLKYGKTYIRMVQTRFEYIRIRQNRYSNGRKRDSNTFEFAKTDIQISENQYSNIVFVIFGFRFSIFSLVMTYELYVGRPPCCISVHPRLDFDWSDVASGCVKQQYGWIGLLPRLHVTYC